ncbi:hypothetical protein CSC94_07255 [Zhengella mangrovi]|uniref:VWFA domain-containing protein n=1 Tax=Zhengella mangrovi TaxID=1982044 RepID=A0A2G1QPM3_9HYPH|nr:VWA domain-containing protein [Zhengella mangrovi]PHP67497.1 hypothetical protein CSC94_07255 [Zhengella mangrovi]
MTGDDKLKRLAGHGLEAPRAEARERAVLAAMEAFDAAADDEAGEKNQAVPQGSGKPGRLISIATQAWRKVMTPKTLAGPIAAAILVLPFGGYFAWQMMDTSPLTQTQQQSGGIGGLMNLNSGQPAATPQAPEIAAEPAPSPAPGVSTFGPGRVMLRQAPGATGAARDSFLQQGVGHSAAKSSRQGGEAAKQMVQGLPVSPDTATPMEDRDRLESFDNNPVRAVLESPVSTFSIDVDTASYAFVRSQLNAGRLPAPDTVRVEELVNYFPYDWPAADSAEQPFKPTVTVAPSPWNEHRKLMHIAIKGYDVQPATRPQANLVFLIDTSGSMNAPDKLPLLKTSFRLLLDKLDAKDKVSIVTYAGSAGVALEPTSVSEKAKILAAIDALGAGGSTAGAAGIETAYRLAQENFVKDGVNRVMLATDGDFNVGPSSDKDLKTMIEAEREKGIFLSVFGFGRGNYNDQLMQVLAQNGNGTAAYIDTLGEAQKTLVEEATSTLFPIAKDVKIQVEFNPATVAEYRLVGYETRALNREDFNDDRKDAGDIGSGHSVTAIYEITPKGSPAQQIDDLRYQSDAAEAGAGNSSDEYGFVKIRYKKPDSDTSQLITQPVTSANEIASLDQGSNDLRFSVAVAGFGQKLRKTSQVADTGWDAIATLAAGARGDDPYGYRSEFLRLVQIAKTLDSAK